MKRMRIQICFHLNISLDITAKAALDLNKGNFEDTY